MPSKTKPIPVRLDRSDRAFVDDIASSKGVPQSEVLRRCVRLLGQEVKKRGPKWDWIEETSHPLLPIKTSDGTEAVKEVLDAEDTRRSRSRRARKSS